MSNTFYLKIIAAERVVYDGRAQIVVVTASDGEVAVMAHHQNMIMATKVGDLKYRVSEDSDWVELAAGIGFIHVANNRVTVLVDTVEKPEDIDRVRAEQAMERAKEQLRQKQSIQEYHVSQASMARAMYRLKKTTVHDIK